MSVRVICEFCKTVYNIPEQKLVRDVSRATCKVCQNQIIIRREEVTGRSVAPTDPSMEIPTEIKPPRPAPAQAVIPAAAATAADLATDTRTSTAVAAGFGPDSDLVETELSNSWREAIVDNRQTIAMLKKVGVDGPSEGSTATGGRAPDETALADGGQDIELADPAAEARQAAARNAGRANGSSTRGPSPALRGPVTFHAVDRAASAPASAVTGLAGAAAAAALVHNGGWGLGLSGVGALGACAFVAAAGLLNALFRRRTGFAFVLVLLLAGLAAAGTVAGVLAKGGATTRALAAIHPFLEPFARMTLPVGSEPAPAPGTPPGNAPGPGPEGATDEAAPPADP